MAQMKSMSSHLAEFHSKKHNKKLAFSKPSSNIYKDNGNGGI